MVTELEHFSYSIGHDMRAPLRAMKSFAALLEESEESAGHPENRNVLRRISASAGRLDALIQGSLDYARVIKQISLLNK
jgi:light-regulated signal transduction histidine kinase (bacteriophytochrome)